MPNPLHNCPRDTPFILIGEDDHDDQELLRETFHRLDENMALVFVNSGIEILQVLEELPDEIQPCLLILDYNMPGLTGGEILKAIHGIERYNDLPKILWSTSGAEKFRLACLKLGAHDYFIKPSSYNELVRIAEYMLGVCRKNSL